MQTASQEPGLRTYYLLVATQLVSQLGSRISVFAVAIAVFAKTAHATPIAIISFCQALPWILGAGFAGALVDRYDRRRLLVVANIGFVITSGLLLASFASGAFRLWHLYALTLVNASILTVSGPAFQASVAMLVPDGHRDRANAIGQMIGPASNAISPAIAGLLYAVIGVTGAIAIDIATFGLAILVLLAVRIAFVGLERLEAALQEIEGLGSDVETSVGLPIALGDAFARHLFWAVDAVQDRRTAAGFHERADMIALRSGPKAIVQDNIDPAAEAARPNRLKQAKNRRRLLREKLCWWILAE
jgi:MFS family permease